jgi:hypothetical protein
MGISTSVKIFIYPDETKLLLLKTTGLYRSNPDGSGQSFIQSGNYYVNYVYDEVSGFIYFINQTTGNVWRNTTAFDFTAFTDLGNFFPSSAISTGTLIKVNNGRIIFGGGNYLKYTDNLFVSTTDISGIITNLAFLLYEGGDNVLGVSNVANYNYYRSTDNGLTWPLISIPLGRYTVYAGYKV